MIYPKIDWFTAMVRDTTIRSVFEWLRLEHGLYDDDFLHDMYQRTNGFDDTFVFHYEGINIEVKNLAAYGEIDSDIYDKVLPAVRLELTGHGLDFLRSKEIDIDGVLADQTQLLTGMHCTRCDFAFDLVNYLPDFLDKCIDYIDNNHTEDNRLILYRKVGNSLVYDLRRGQQKTLYIGSPRSDHLLRIYDKKMQFTDLKTGLYKKDNDYENPDSWIRIELQTRNAAAQKLLYSLDPEQRFMDILKYIYERYSFADLSTPAHRRLPAQFWIDLFDWSTIPSLIVQNINFGTIQSESDRVVGLFKRDIQSIICALLVLRKKGQTLDDLISAYIAYLQDRQEDPVHDLSRSRRYRRFVLRLNECGITNADLNDINSKLRVMSGCLVWDKGLK